MNITKKMIISNENKCMHCSKIFCCPQCRIEHELKSHVSGTSKTFHSCALCLGNKLKLQLLHTSELLHHIAATHRPLHCNKCNKIFSAAADFESITGCKNMCDLQTQNLLPEKDGTVAIAQNPNSSKFVTDNDTSAQSPALQGWKDTGVPKDSYEGSLSSIRVGTSPAQENMTSGNFLQQTVSPKKKLVRQTSTPMHQANVDMHPNHQNGINRPHSFDSITSSCQMSTISSSYICESDASPPVEQNKNASTSYPSYKTSTRIRAKFPATATPLRQVMSKSIQKAIVEHGLPHFLTVSQHKYSPSIGYGNTSTRSPLDLRTSPVIRRDTADRSSTAVRSKAHNFEETCFTTQKNKKLTFGSSSEYSLDTVYETCKSLEEIPPQTVPTSAANVISSSEGIVSAEVETEVFQTPKSTGSLKKTASFADNINACNDDDNEEWFTPSSLQRSYSYTETKETRYSVMDGGKYSTEDVFGCTDTNFCTENTSNADNKIGKVSLWSLLSSVFRLASFGTIKATPKGPHESQNTDNEALQTSKRRRSNTGNYPIQSDIKRLKRIHGRPPLERMRKSS